MRIVITDANVLINLMHVSRLSLLAKLPHHEFVIPEQVRNEILHRPYRAMLDAAIREGWVRLEALTDLEAVKVFTELIEHLGRGEAACIAIAAQHGWYIASDEKRRFRREAAARVGQDRILGTVDLFVLGIRAKLLTIEEADADKLALERHRFKVPFASYRELVAPAGAAS